MPAFTPADFVLSCMERGYRLVERDGAVCFAPAVNPPAKVQAFLQQYQSEVAEYFTGKPAETVNTAPVVSDVFNDFSTSPAEEEFTLPEVIEKPFCDSILAIMPASQWEILFHVFRFSQDSYHVLDFVKRLNLSQDTLQKALDELARRGAVRRCEGHPKAVCLHIPFIGSHGVEVPAVFYRGWPGNLDLAQLTEESPDAPVAAAHRSNLVVNVPDCAAGQVEQFALEGLE